MIDDLVSRLRRMSDAKHADCDPDTAYLLDEAAQALALRPEGVTPAQAVVETDKQFAKRAAKEIMNSADAQCFRWLLKHHSGSGKAIAGHGMRCWIGGVEFVGDDVATAILDAIDKEAP